MSTSVALSCLLTSIHTKKDVAEHDKSPLESPTSLEKGENTEDESGTITPFETPPASPVSEEEKELPPLPKCAEFIRMIHARPHNEDESIHTLAENADDKKKLSSILRKHNEIFTDQEKKTSKSATGFEERIDLQTGNQIFVRADLHSDIGTLLGQLECLKAKKLLDENYHCAPGFHMIFLGDFCDRGCNDIEMLALLFLLHIENPHSVHLIRGNHDDVDYQIEKEASGSYSLEYKWIQRHRDLLDPTYNSLPLGICIGDSSPTKKGKREYIYCSHGALSTSRDLSTLIDGKVDTLPVEPTFDPLKPEHKEKEAPWEEKKREARENLVATTLSIGAHQPYMHQWGQIETATRPLTERGLGWALSPYDVYDYTQATRTETAIIKATLHGHVHTFNEYSIETRKNEKKVVSTTLPTGTMFGFTKNSKKVKKQPVQGLLLTVAPRVKDWTKEAMMYDEKTFTFSGKPVPMYEELIPSEPLATAV